MNVPGEHTNELRKVGSRPFFALAYPSEELIFIKLVYFTTSIDIVFLTNRRLIVRII